MGRHSDALAIQQGACNPTAIVLSMRRAIEEIGREPGFNGTASVTGDPALRLMIHQLAYICGVNSGASDMSRAPLWDDCMEICRKSVQVTAPIKEWSGHPDPEDPDNFWIDDATGERVAANTVPTMEKHGYTQADVNAVADATEQFGDDALEQHDPWSRA